MLETGYGILNPSVDPDLVKPVIIETHSLQHNDPAQTLEDLRAALDSSLNLIRYHLISNILLIEMTWI